jgi:hypothetical protein
MSDAVNALTPVERIQLASLLVNGAAADIDIDRPKLADRVWREVKSLGRLETAVRIKLATVRPSWCAACDTDAITVTRGECDTCGQSVSPVSARK